MNCLSINAVLKPAFASFLASGVPACPDPMMMASYVFISFYSVIFTPFQNAT